MVVSLSPLILLDKSFFEEYIQLFKKNKNRNNTDNDFNKLIVQWVGENNSDLDIVLRDLWLKC